MRSGGRKKGVANFKTLQVQELADKLGCNPFEILINFAKGDFKALGYENELYFKETANGEVKAGYVISPEIRAKCALEACKYLYPQRKAIEVDATITTNNPFAKMTTEEKIEKAKEVQELLLIQGQKK